MASKKKVSWKNNLKTALQKNSDEKN